MLVAALGGFGGLWVSVGLFAVSAVLTVVTVPASLSPAPEREPYPPRP